MGKFTLFDENGNISQGAILIIVGMAGLLISVLVVGVMEESLVGSRVQNERLGNMTANATTFTLDNQYSTQGTYMIFAIANNSLITSSLGATAITECNAAGTVLNCYNATSETNTVLVSFTAAGGGFASGDNIWVNYTASELGGQALTSGNTIATYVGTALTLISVGLIVLGAGLILSYLTNWRN